MPASLGVLILLSSLFRLTSGYAFWLVSDRFSTDPRQAYGSRFAESSARRSKERQNSRQEIAPRHAAGGAATLATGLNVGLIASARDTRHRSLALCKRLMARACSVSCGIVRSTEMDNSTKS